MTEPLIDVPRTSANGTHARTTDAAAGPAPAPEHAASDHGVNDEVAPGTPRWVKAFGIILVVLLLAFVGLHLTGNAPTHMDGPSGTEHSVQVP